ncbi:MAG TPA: toxin-antitoxin system HicB family antitoxin [Thermoanaerobaculia bacterium]|nr:toxin-antitoxin system HicB family antitoxin [Thermoanaerobaculia bacterium]
MEPWEQYSYRVFWSAEDGEYVGVCTELLGLSWLAKKPEAALRGVRGVAREAVEILRQDGDRVPEPIAARAYSGVFKVRIPPEVHRGLVQEASEQGVSLNRLVTVKLAGGAKPRAARKPARRVSTHPR